MSSRTDDVLFGHATLLDELDRKVMVLLRDGRTLIGVLRSVDQFANLVLDRTTERIHVGKQFGDIYRGIFVVRGENVVVVGLIDEMREGTVGLQEVSVEEILEAQRQVQEARHQQEQLRVKAMKERGLTYTADLGPDDMY
ncbi:U6 snRNA-associated Sm-like protein LSm1 isoform X1 [Amphibalanus amphitrite]|nr:U6 snRNA-associated Sm-like protein LSm1 isoform X2 [Amphibalanus amphitrite]XP_043209356.1 U6 snRNA-associated Sm-like protein LSm1 isoform X2 [Amphibalanus amphitrite]XP_043225317.1 U6 snRNA-associated Sm-like protein LSm1 isoform X1 [Amphibalanus amphitrite]XP_043225319.1 U6 snRNA-associated Sm-like protein LSm1 isoform X1 [Amphibalanus amphitrite]